MLEHGGGVLALDIRHRMRTTIVADQQAVAIGEVARVRRLAMRRDEAAIGVLGVPRRNALGDDPAGGVLAQMDHLGAGIDLLAPVRDRDRIELAARTVTAQDAGRVFPGDGGAGLDLSPGDDRVLAPAIAALGDEVVDPALALGIAGIPVLHGGIFDLRFIERHEFDHGGVKLVLVALGCRAAFEIADIGALVGDDQRALELAGILLVDAEIGREFHRAAHARRHIDERPVGEDGGVQRGIVVVALGHDGAEILLHQLGVFPNGFRDRAEDHARIGQFLLEGRGDGDGIEYGIDRDPVFGSNAGEHFLLTQRNAELLVGLEDLGIDLVERLRRLVRLRSGVIVDIVEIYLGIADARPVRLLHGQPAAIGVETPFQHPFRLFLLGRNEADDVFAQALGGLLHLDDGLEAILVLIDVDFLNAIDRFLHCRHVTLLSRLQGPRTGR